jgi:hypothetical protein
MVRIFNVIITRQIRHRGVIYTHRSCPLAYIITFSGEVIWAQDQLSEVTNILPPIQFIPLLMWRRFFFTLRSGMAATSAAATLADIQREVDRRNSFAEAKAEQRIRPASARVHLRRTASR